MSVSTVDTFRIDYTLAIVNKKESMPFIAQKTGHEWVSGRN